MKNSVAVENPNKQLFGHPVGLYILFFTEMWERFSYYGMRGLLVLYVSTSMTADDPGLGWTTQEALALYGWYTMLVYLMSIPGGILADRMLGQKKTVMLGGILLVLGHGVLAVPSQWAFFLGLTLIVFGVGGLKPNISTMVGGLYAEGDTRRDKAFTLFYVGINIGAFLAGIIVGIMAKEYGWHIGFGLAGIGMLLGQIVYAMGQKHLVHVGNYIGVKKEAEGVNKSDPLTKIEKDRIVVLLISFLIVIVFWGAFEQAGGLMNLYTDTKIDRTTGLTSGPNWIQEIPTVVFQSLNSTYIIIFGAIVAVIWVWMRRTKREASSLFKMAIGTIIMGLGFVFMIFATQEAGVTAFGKASMFWIFMAYMFHTLGELCCSPVAMSFITKLAPARYVSIMMGIYFAATGMGNKIAGLLGENSQIEPTIGVVTAPVQFVNMVSGKQPIDGTEYEDYPMNYDKNVTIQSKLYLNMSDEVVFQQNEGAQEFSHFFKWNNDFAKIKKILKDNNINQSNPYHAQLLLEKIINNNDETPTFLGDGKNYRASFVIEEQQTQKEYEVFLYITIFAVTFGLLLIVFLKKLKKLTHDAEYY